MPVHEKYRKNKKIAAQSAVEYLITYSWAILIVALVVMLILIFLTSSSNAVPTRCSFTSDVQCSDIVFGSAAGASNALLLLSNPSSYPILNPVLTVKIGNAANVTGSCIPSYVLPGGTFFCTATIPGTFATGSLQFANLYLQATPCANGNAIQCSGLHPQTYTGTFQTQYQANVPVIKPQVIISVANATTVPYVQDLVSVTVKFDGNPLSGADVNFTSNDIDVSFSPSKAVTNSNGQTSSYLDANHTGAAAVTASFGRYSNTIIVNIVSSDSITFTQTSGASSSDVLTVDGQTYGTAQLPVTFYWVPNSTQEYGYTNDPGKPTVSGCGVTSQSGLVKVISSCTITASYTTVQYALTVNNAGCTSVSGAGTYTAGSSQQISAVVPGGDTFSWSGTGSGNYIGSANPAGVIMDSDITETATCTASSACYSLTLSASPAGSGTTSNSIVTGSTCSGGYTSGSTVHISTAPVGTNSFVEWIGSGTGNYYGTNTINTITMQSNIIDTATYSSSAVNVVVILAAGNTVVQGANDIATGETSQTGDTVVLKYCDGSSCSPSNVLNAGTTNVVYNIGYLDTGIYTIDACDVNAMVCSATNVITVLSQAASYIYCTADDGWGDDTQGVFYSELATDADNNPSNGILAWEGDSNYAAPWATNPYPQDLVAAGCSINLGYMYCVGDFVGDAKATYSAPVSSSGVGSWTATTPYPVNMADAGCSTYNGYIYCVGTSNTMNATPGGYNQPYTGSSFNQNNGYYQAGIVSSNDVYYATVSNGIIGTWTATNSYPTEMYDAGCSIYQGYIYCVGTAGTTDAEETYYAPILQNGGASNGIGTWSAGTPYPIPFYDAGCSIYNGYIYCVGDSSYTTTANSMILSGNSSYYAKIDPASGGIGTWTESPWTYPTGFDDGEGCAIYSGYIYCSGSSGPDVYYTQLSNSGGFPDPWWATTPYGLPAVVDEYPGGEGYGYGYCQIPGGTGGYLGGGGYN